MASQKFKKIKDQLSQVSKGLKEKTGQAVKKTTDGFRSLSPSSGKEKMSQGLEQLRDKFSASKSAPGTQANLGQRGQALKQWGQNFGQNMGQRFQQSMEKYPRLGQALSQGGEKVGGIIASKSPDFWMTSGGIFLSAYFLSDIPALMWNKLITVPPQPTQVSSQTRVRPPQLQDYQVIFDRCLTNSQGKCKEKISQVAQGDPTGRAVKTRLPLSLVGVLILEKPNGQVDERSIGTLQERRGGQDKVHPLRVGDEIQNLLRVTSIEERRVVFINLRSRRNEFVELPEDTLQPRPVFKRPTPAPKVDKTSQDRYSVSRQKINDSLEDFGNLLTQVKAMPTGQGTYRLSQIVKGSIFEELGLKNNDELVAVDGEGLKDPTKAFQYLEKLKSAEEVEITIKRNGQTRNLRFDIN